MDDCVFCKIVNGQIPSAKIYENEKVLAFLDIAPVNKGHVLIIPKEHYEKLEDMPDNIIKEVFVAAKKISMAIKKGVDCNAINFGMNNGKEAGQLVMHAHIHVMPRFKGDGLKLWPQGKYEELEMENFREKIKRFL